MDLEFVDMNAASAAERKRNQKVIRSTAMKSFRRRQKSQRQEAGIEKIEQKERSLEVETERKPCSSNIKKPVSGNSLAPAAGQPQINLSDISLPVQLRWSSTSDGSGGGEGSPQDESGGVQIKVLKEQDVEIASALNEPRSQLGAGRIDPFCRLPIDVNSLPHAPRLLDHSITVLWRGLRPRGDNGTISSLGAAWFQETNQRPIVMHAMLFGAQVHLDVLRSPRISIHNPVALYHKVQTMRLLKEELKNQGDIPLDDIILAILTLSANEVETVANNIIEKEISPFNSPLANMQWLNVYGSITHLGAHVVAMRSLVSRRGGLENIELNGLAEVLSFSDTLAATQSLKKPYWPLLKRTLTMEDIYIPDILRLPLRRLGQGFLGLMAFGITNQSLSAIQTIVDFTAIIDCHCRGVKLIKDPTQFIDKRNAVQHQLISLPSGEELTEGLIGSPHIYECVRLAMMIYSAAVTFPLPPITGIFHRLAYLLRNVLEKSRAEPHWRSSSRPLLWILVMGGIAAFGTIERSWYVRSLAAVLSAMKLSAWKQVSDEMGHYLWLESACDSAGRLLWIEVQTVESRRP